MSQIEEGKIEWLVNVSDLGDGANEETMWFETEEYSDMLAEAKRRVAEGCVVRIARVMVELRPSMRSVAIKAPGCGPHELARDLGPDGAKL